MYVPDDGRWPKPPLGPEEEERRRLQRERWKLSEALNAGRLHKAEEDRLAAERDETDRQLAALEAKRAQAAPAKAPAPAARLSSGPLAAAKPPGQAAPAAKPLVASAGQLGREPATPPIAAGLRPADLGSLPSLGDRAYPGFPKRPETPAGLRPISLQPSAGAGQAPISGGGAWPEASPFAGPGKESPLSAAKAGAGAGVAGTPQQGNAPDKPEQLARAPAPGEPLGDPKAAAKPKLDSLEGRSERDRDAKVEAHDDFQSTARHESAAPSTIEEKQVKEIDREISELSRRLRGLPRGSAEYEKTLERIGLYRETKRRVLQGPAQGKTREEAYDFDEGRKRRFGGGFGSMALDDLQYADAVAAQEGYDSGAYARELDQLKEERDTLKKDRRDGETEAADLSDLELEIAYREKMLEVMGRYDQAYSDILRKIGEEGYASPKLTMEDLNLIESRSRFATFIGGVDRNWPEPGSDREWKSRFLTDPERAVNLWGSLRNFSFGRAGKGKF